MNIKVTVLLSVRFRAYYKDKKPKEMPDWQGEIRTGHLADAGRKCQPASPKESQDAQMKEEL